VTPGLLAAAVVGAMVPASAGDRGLTWDEMAAELGCPQRVHMQDRPDGLRVMEYVRRGETVERWTLMLTIQQMPIPSDDRGANEAIHEVIDNISKDLSQQRVKPRTFHVYKGDYGEVLFTEFTVGGEWNLMIACRAGPGIIAICSLAGRGGAPTAKQRTLLRSQIGLS
jgi:hypothetical protein